MKETNRRWDSDETGHGIADGSLFAPDVRRLLEAMTAPQWIAEAPDIHLLPHLQQVCAAPGSPWQLLTAELVASLYEITLEWVRDERRMGRLREDVFRLLGAVAESATYVHQRVMNDEVIYDVCTGMLEGDSPFRSHGHLIRLRIRGGVVKAMLMAMRDSGSA